MAAFTNDIGGGFGLTAGAIVDGLGVDVILITPETPIANIVFVQMFTGLTQFRDNYFVRQAILDHAVDFRAESKGQASDFAIATGFGLAGLELAVEVVLQRIGGVE